MLRPSPTSCSGIGRGRHSQLSDLIIWTFILRRGSNRIENRYVQAPPRSTFSFNSLLRVTDIVSVLSGRSVELEDRESDISADNWIDIAERCFA
jgi:hypothetical protein